MATDLSGKEFSGFAVERELGRGGMGSIWLARQSSLDRPAVLKQIRPDLAELPELAERFQREARAAAALHHPNVVAIYDYFGWRGRSFIAQEYVEGIDLATMLGRSGRIPPRIAGLIALELTRGLEAIHRSGTVHRDLKPANVLLGRSGEVKVADFGLALEATSSRLTEPGVAIGSPTYMPPEQMMGERVDARADLFSLGIIMYELLTGFVPYPQPTEGEEGTLLRRMQRERYPRLRRHAPKTPRRVAKLVRSCLRARASARPDSVTPIRKALEGWLRVGSPEDLRDEIADWLARTGNFEEGDAGTIRVAVYTDSDVTVTDEDEPWHPLAVLGSAVAGALLLGVLLWEVGLVSLPISLPLPSSLPARAAPRTTEAASDAPRETPADITPTPVGSPLAQAPSRG